MRRKFLLTVALAVLGTAVTAAVVNGQAIQEPGDGGGLQSEPPPPDQPACSNTKDDDGDGQIDAAVARLLDGLAVDDRRGDRSPKDRKGNGE